MKKITISKEQEDLICDQLKEGKSLREICIKYKDKLPSRRTILRELGRNDKFLVAYANARKVQADVILDEILETARGSIEDEDFRRANAYRCKGELLKFVVGKLNPKKYGSQSEITHKGVGSDGEIVFKWDDDSEDKDKKCCKDKKKAE